MYRRHLHRHQNNLHQFERAAAGSHCSKSAPLYGSYRTDNDNAATTNPFASISLHFVPSRRERISTTVTTIADNEPDDATDLTKSQHINNQHSVIRAAVENVFRNVLQKHAKDLPEHKYTFIGAIQKIEVTEMKVSSALQFLQRLTLYFESAVERTGMSAQSQRQQPSPTAQQQQRQNRSIVETDPDEHTPPFTTSVVAFVKQTVLTLGTTLRFQTYKRNDTTMTPTSVGSRTFGWLWWRNTWKSIRQIWWNSLVKSLSPNNPDSAQAGISLITAFVDMSLFFTLYDAIGANRWGLMMSYLSFLLTTETTLVRIVRLVSLTSFLNVWVANVMSLGTVEMAALAENIIAILIGSTMLDVFVGSYKFDFNTEGIMDARVKVTCKDAKTGKDIVIEAPLVLPLTRQVNTRILSVQSFFPQLKPAARAQLVAMVAADAPLIPEDSPSMEVYDLTWNFMAYVESSFKSASS